MKILKSIFLGIFFFIIEMFTHYASYFIVTERLCFKYDFGNKNCAWPLDFFGFFGIRILIIIVFFLLHKKYKSFKYPFYFILGYSVLSLIFHANIIPSTLLDSLHWRLGMGNFLGVIFAFLMLFIGSVLATVSSTKNRLLIIGAVISIAVILYIGYLSLWF